jgi:hypothetical protein
MNSTLTRGLPMIMFQLKASLVYYLKGLKYRKREFG